MKTEQLPENWNERPFEKCLEKIKYPLKIHKKEFLIEGSFPIISQEKKFINGYWNNEDNLFQIKKPVIIFGDHTQVIKYVDFDFVLGADGVKIIEPIGKINSKFLYYFLKSVKIKRLGYARHYRLLKEKLIPIPPSEEQKQIVKILNEAFNSISKSKEAAEKNLENAKELFESYLEGVFSNPRESWEEKKLGEIANVEYGFTCKAKSRGDFRYVRITDTGKDGLLTQNNKVYLDKSKEMEKFVLSDKDLVMARTGATFAEVLFYKNREPSVFASYLIRIKFKKEILNKLYWYFSKSRNYWNQANYLSSGAAQPHFNGGALKEVVFNYPKSITKQKTIVSKLDALSKEIKELEVIYSQKVKNLDELKKSILQKAFSGELTK